MAGKERHGAVWLGAARKGMARHGVAWQAGLGMAWRGTACHGVARQDRQGAVRLGMVCRGLARHSKEGGLRATFLTYHFSSQLFEVRMDAQLSTLVSLFFPTETSHFSAPLQPTRQ